MLCNRQPCWRSRRPHVYGKHCCYGWECRSKTCKHSLNPKWSESLSLNVRSEKETLIVKLYDEDRIGKDDFIGQALVPLSDISLDGTPMGFDLTLQLHTKQQPTGGATRASVAVELTFNPLS